MVKIRQNKKNIYINCQLLFRFHHLKELFNTFAVDLIYSPSVSLLLLLL